MPIYKVYDAWDLQKKLRCPLCITTNGFVTSKGLAVMGRGIARESSIQFPGIKEKLGEIIKSNGNICQPIPIKKGLISFPTKPDKMIIEAEEDFDKIVPHMKSKFTKYYIDVPGWACISDLDIITKSCRELVDLINKYNLKKVILPFPGIGAGFLKVEDVKNILDMILPENVIVVTKPKKG